MNSLQSVTKDISLFRVSFYYFYCNRAQFAPPPINVGMQNYNIESGSGGGLEYQVCILTMRNVGTTSTIFVTDSSFDKIIVLIFSDFFFHITTLRSLETRQHGTLQ